MTAPSGASVQGQQFVISRDFDAPRDLVFAAFTSSDRMAHWWGPKGFEMTVFRFEFRPGGIFLYKLEAPDGTTMWARFVFREIAEPDRLVFVNSFADEAGNIARAPFFDGTWPLEVLTTVTLEEQADKKTTVTLRSHPIDATEVEEATFRSNHGSMTQGFGSAFDQLRALLEREQANGSGGSTRCD
jgi:uncharacterized protein YndB with AHSA1/START domain